MQDGPTSTVHPQVLPRVRGPPGSLITVQIPIKQVSLLQSQSGPAAARGVTMRIINNGENFVRELVEPPKWLTLFFDTSRQASVASIPEVDDNFTTLSMCLSSTLQALDQHADGLGLVASQTQIVSPTPTWDTINLIHPTYENETHVPIFSGWASFCGSHTPPILVPRTHWDDRVAGNRQAKLDEMDHIMSTSVTVTSWKKQKEPVCTGTRPARPERQLSGVGSGPSLSSGYGP